MSYTVTDTHKFGHGEASVAIIEKFLGVLGLTTEERMAIRYHMGDFANERETSEVYNRYPLAAMLHMADLAATYLEERECTDQMDVFWDTVKAFARPVKAPEQAQPATADAPKPDAETPSKQEMPRGPFRGRADMEQCKRRRFLQLNCGLAEPDSLSAQPIPPLNWKKKLKGGECTIDIQLSNNKEKVIVSDLPDMGGKISSSHLLCGRSTEKQASS